MKTMKTRSLTIAISLAATMLLAACGGEESSAEGAGGAAAPATSTITMVDNSFEPNAPVIASGDVQLANEGQSPHTFTIDRHDVDVEIAAGKTATATVDLPTGTYTLYCRFHRSQGMETVLTVQ